MGDGHRLAKMMREAGRTPQNEVVDIVEGEVTSVSPLKVKVDNRELTEALLLSARAHDCEHGLPSNQKLEHPRCRSPAKAGEFSSKRERPRT